MQIRRGFFCLTVMPMSCSTYYRLEDESAPRPSVLLEVQIFDDGTALDYLKTMQLLEDEKVRQATIEVLACGIARLKALQESYPRN